MYVHHGRRHVFGDLAGSRTRCVKLKDMVTIEKVDAVDGFGFAQDGGSKLVSLGPCLHGQRRAAGRASDPANATESSSHSCNGTFLLARPPIAVAHDLRTCTVLSLQCFTVAPPSPSSQENQREDSSRKERRHCTVLLACKRGAGSEGSASSATRTLYCPQIPFPRSFSESRIPPRNIKPLDQLFALLG